jgi:ACS family glucarate transporter-like MFS transporter
MASASSSTARPSRVRYLVLALTTMVAVLLYLDRICLAFAEGYVREELGITKSEMAIVLSSFFWTYAIGQLPGGWLSDRYGARLMLALYLALWSSFTGLLGFAYSMLALFVFRLGCGLFEAGAYPAAAGIIGNWVPSQRRGIASGVVSVGGRFGGAAAFLLFPLLMVAFVPVSVSSLLDPADFLDETQLFPHLTESPNTDSSIKLKSASVPMLLGKRIYEHLPADVRQEFAQGTAPRTAAIRTRLAESLNHMLGMPDFLDGIQVEELNLPLEAWTLLEPSRTVRPPEEVQRRNRLALEGAFPEAIRKVYGLGWRPVMMTFCVAGLIVAVIFWWFFRDRPRLHPRCNAGEIALIEGEAGLHDPAAPPSPLPFACLLTSGGLWISSAVQLLTNLGWAFLITWLTSHLRDTYNVPPFKVGLMTCLPILVGILGMLGGGWMTDYLTYRLGKRWGRAGPLAFTRFLVAGAFVACLFLHSPWPVTIAMCVVALGTDLGTPAVWAYSLDVGGKHVGSVLGWTNMFGNIGAALSPLLAVPLSSRWGSGGMFLTFASAFILAGVLSLFLDATKLVVPDDRHLAA